jgi:hypothetical protein
VPTIVRRILVYPSLLALATACADSTVGPSTPEGSAPSNARHQAASADISGSWSFHEDATFVLYHFGGGRGAKVFRCSSDGTYTFAQTGETFTGSYDQVGTCAAADGTTFPNDFTGVTVEGAVHGRHLTFETADGCSYQGALKGPTLSEMGGAGKCGGGGTFGTYRPTWSATR